jgi:hypothetical protein
MTDPKPQKPETPPMSHLASWAIAGLAVALFITLVMVFVNLQEKTVGYWEKPKLAQPPQILPQATLTPVPKPREPKPAVDVVKTAPETLVWETPAKGLEDSRATGKALLYFFTDGKSGLCRKVESDFFADGQVAARINRSCIAVRVTDETSSKGQNSAEVMGLENKYQVTSFPTLAVQVQGRKDYKKMISYTDAPSAMSFLNSSIK